LKKNKSLLGRGGDEKLINLNNDDNMLVPVFESILDKADLADNVKEGIQL